MNALTKKEKSLEGGYKYGTTGIFILQGKGPSSFFFSFFFFFSFLFTCPIECEHAHRFSLYGRCA